MSTLAKSWQSFLINQITIRDVRLVPHVIKIQHTTYEIPSKMMTDLYRRTSVTKKTTARVPKYV